MRVRVRVRVRIRVRVRVRVRMGQWQYIYRFQGVLKTYVLILHPTGKIVVVMVFKTITNQCRCIKTMRNMIPLAFIGQ